MQNNIDKITKEIISNSQLELPNPVFNYDVMRMVENRAHRKTKQKLFLSLLFAFAIIASAAYLVMRIFSIDFPHLVKDQDRFSGSASRISGNLSDLAVGAECLIIPLLLILIVKKIIEPEIKYS